MKAALVSAGLLATILALPAAAQAHDRHDGRYFGVHDRHAQHVCHDRRHGHHPKHSHRHDHGRHHGWAQGHWRATPWYAYQPRQGYRDGDRNRGRDHRNDWDRRR